MNIYLLSINFQGQFLNSFFLRIHPSSFILHPSSFILHSHFNLLSLLFLLVGETFKKKKEKVWIPHLPDQGKKFSPILPWKWPSNPKKLDEIGQNSWKNKKISKKVWILDPRPPHHHPLKFEIVGQILSKNSFLASQKTRWKSDILSYL